MPIRKIKLVHLTDGFVRTAEDDGCSRDGSPNVARQQLEGMLGKLVPEKDGNGQVLIGDDGQPVVWPLYRLAEAPQPLRYNTADPKQAACAAADTFDHKELRIEGRWKLPSPAWLEASDRFKAKRKAKHNEYDAVAIQKAQLNVGAVMQELLLSARSAIEASAAAPPPPAPAKKGGARGEAQT